MPEVRAHRSVPRPLTEVWAFVREMDNWAPMLRGYVGHEKHSETKSTWTLTGELGPFSKTVDLAVEVTEWVDADRVGFALSGVTEQVTGRGMLSLRADAPERTAWQAFWDWLFRRSQVGKGDANLTFDFAIDAQGPMGPMINPMLGPYADLVARDLLDKVAAHVSGEAAS